MKLTQTLSPLLSITIPTLNRSEYLCKALRSIFAAEWDRSKVEICISNNASDEDYSAVESLVKTAPHGLVIRYVVQPSRLPIDEHMMAVKNLAMSPYIYFLGDDDFFLDNQLPLLLELIEREAPDLAIFNGMIVDAQDRVMGSHFSLAAQRYTDIGAAFHDLRDKGMFGAVLVKAEHLDNRDFKCLFGTAHGYGCYWFSLLKRDALSQGLTILVPAFPLVALRMAAKSYSLPEVYYRDIPYEIAVYQRFLPPGRAQDLNHQFKLRYLRKISSVKFITYILSQGTEKSKLRKIDPGFYRQYRLSIFISQILANTGAYEFLKSLYRSICKWKQHLK